MTILLTHDSHMHTQHIVDSHMLNILSLSLINQHQSSSFVIQKRLKHKVAVGLT